MAQSGHVMTRILLGKGFNKELHHRRRQTGGTTTKHSQDHFLRHQQEGKQKETEGRQDGHTGQQEERQEGRQQETERREDRHNDKQEGNRIETRRTK